MHFGILEFSNDLRILEYEITACSAFETHQSYAIRTGTLTLLNGINGIDAHVLI